MVQSMFNHVFAVVIVDEKSSISTFCKRKTMRGANNLLISSLVKIKTGT